MNYQIDAPGSAIRTTVKLPASKSISNRALILNALSYSAYDVENLSDCDDTNLMVKALNSNDRILMWVRRVHDAFPYCFPLEGGGRMDDYGNRTHEEPSDQGVGGCAERFRRPDRVHGEGGLSPLCVFSEAPCKAERSRYREMLALNIYPLS